MGCKNISENDVDEVRIDPLTLNEWLSESPDAYLILDARSQSDFQSEHIPGAEHIATPSVDPNNIDPRFEQYKAVVVYGQNPAFGRANVLTKRFLEAGVDVFMLDGGLMQWKLQGLPITRNASGDPLNEGKSPADSE